jgi:Mn2+/Fe2+ NRAMP family transporter
MKKTLARLGTLLLALVLLAVGQSACGGGGYSSPTAPSNAPGQPTPTPRAGGGGY